MRYRDTDLREFVKRGERERANCKTDTT
jgi:hypothetical protein